MLVAARDSQLRRLTRPVAPPAAWKDAPAALAGGPVKGTALGREVGVGPAAARTSIAGTAL